VLHTNVTGIVILCLAEATFHAIHFDFDGKVSVIPFIVAQADYALLKHYRAVKVVNSSDTMLNNRWYILSAIILRSFRIESDYDLDWRGIRRNAKGSWKHAANH
jgi:hypothetical protein